MKLRRSRVLISRCRYCESSIHTHPFWYFASRSAPRRQLRIEARFSRTYGRKPVLRERVHRSPERRRDALFWREITDAALGPNLTVPACFARRICANLHSGYVGERRAPL